MTASELPGSDDYDDTPGDTPDIAGENAPAEGAVGQTPEAGGGDDDVADIPRG